MPKRVLDEGSSIHKAKKVKFADWDKNSKSNEKLTATLSSLTSEEIDFPRGGGTSFTPIEVKAIRAEAVQEADNELFEDKKHVKLKKRKSDVKGKAAATSQDKKDQIRVEHLNYKRMVVGMKILGQIISVQPLALVVSLPNQLLGHVPITQISTYLTNILEVMHEDEEPSETELEDEQKQKRAPDLSEIFRPGQYVRAVVTGVHAAGSTDIAGIGRTRDATVKASRRVELSLSPDKVNDGVQKNDLQPGFTLSAAVKSIEDHGYILDLGIPNVSGFLSFKDMKKGSFDHSVKLHVGRLIDISVLKMSDNGRTCTVTVDCTTFVTSALSEIMNVTSLLPGTLVQSLITAVVPSGLNLQILGYFEGTVDQVHLSPGKKYKIGQKVMARVLYDISGTTPAKFALALVDHIVALQIKCTKEEKWKDGPSLQEAYPVGTTLDEVIVTNVEPERGLILEINPGVKGFVHISHVSDDHVPSLSPSSGAWKVNTVHRARVTGYFPFDGLLQLSLRPSILEQHYLQVSDVQVGELIKGTIKRFTDSGLFVSISGNVDGVVWPNHYADIALKHPSKRFKPGANIKCRVLTVDSDRKRIALSAKKTLIESALPILSKFEDANVGLVTHAVVFKVTDKGLQVEFYDGLKAFVPLQEASESTSGKLQDAFPIGKVLKVRIVNTNPETANIIASVRQVTSNFKSAITDISGVEFGDTVEGLISEIHKDNVIITLQPTQVRALMSLINLANHRGLSLPQLRVSLKSGDKVEQVFVVSRNSEKGFVVVSGKPKSKSGVVPKGSLSMETIQTGQIVGGRVTRHGRNGAHVKITARIGGSLHPTDACDNYDAGMPFPAIDSILKAVVVDVDRQRGHLILSTRPSKLYPEQDRAVVDREIKLTDLKAGDTVRGFVKSVADHGLFVMLGREVDARVQIKELFDEYVKDWKVRFEANHVVKGRILSVDLENKKVEMTFRSGDLKRDKTAFLSLTDLNEGQKVDGRIKKVEDYGLFIQIDGSKLSGLCHKSELSDNKDADVTAALRSFREGDLVKVIILSIDRENRKMSLGLKPSYFTDEDFRANNKEESGGPEDPEGIFGVGLEQKENDDMADAAVRNSSDNEVDDDETHHMQVDVDVQSHPFGHIPSVHTTSSEISKTHVPSLTLAEGFQWSVNSTPSEEGAPSDSSSDDGDGDQTRKKKKRKRKAIEQDLTADMHTKMPESNSDFERLLLGSPNSSYLWIQYMSFQLQLAEVEKAREIGQRALKTINFREEQEKLNVWIGLLNLENIYGTEQTLEITFKDAARHNDSKTIYLRLASVFDQTEKFEKAEEQYKRTCKKFGQSSKVWTLFGEHYLRRGDVEEARKLLPRSLQSLEKRKHLKTISKFAQLEYKHGDPERGKTIFEGIIDSHPKRWDLWSIYMDMESGQGDLANLRNLFDRVFSLKMTSHKAKAFFKKWLALEHRLGDEEGAAIVKQKAIEWTQKAVNSS